MNLDRPGVRDTVRRCGLVTFAPLLISSFPHTPIPISPSLPSPPPSPPSSVRVSSTREGGEAVGEGRERETPDGGRVSSTRGQILEDLLGLGTRVDKERYADRNVQ